MSAILEMFTGMVEIVASNPASILIVLGFFGILMGVFLPLGMKYSIASWRTWILYDCYWDNCSRSLASELVTI